MENNAMARLRSWIRNVPPLPWMLAGFAITYTAFFVAPVFFSGPRMDVLGMVVPVMTPIGADLRQTMISVSRLFMGQGTPYVGNIPYPPLVYVLLGPLLLLGSQARYVAFTLLSVTAYLLQAFCFPYRLARREGPTAAMLLIALSGALSYGLLFELERAQFNVLAGLLAYLAILIFHRARRHAVFAYALFSIAVQLKLYPLVFIVMFVDNWHDWKSNARKVLILLAANAALALVLGPRIFVDFVNALRARASFPETIRPDNHSALSFGRLAVEALETRGASALSGAARLLEYALPILIVLCLGVLILRAYRRRSQGLNSPLLLASAVAGITLPPVSHDYTLTILAVPVALFLGQSDLLHADGNWRSIWGPAILLFAIAFSLTLVPPGYKPNNLLWQSNLPALLVLLALTTLLGWSWRVPATGNAD